jgi:hypothetical protein
MIFSWKHILIISFSEYGKNKKKMLHRSSKKGYFLSAKKKTESSIKNMKKKTNRGNNLCKCAEQALHFRTKMLSRRIKNPATQNAGKDWSKRIADSQHQRFKSTPTVGK